MTWGPWSTDYTPRCVYATVEQVAARGEHSTCCPGHRTVGPGETGLAVCIPVHDKVVVQFVFGSEPERVTNIL
jgi:hypothetical protein